MEQRENIAVRLKKAMQLKDLQSEHGAIFEIDPDSIDPGVYNEEENTSGYAPEAGILSETTGVDAGATDSESDSTGEGDSEMPFQKLRKRMKDITENHDGGVMKRRISPGSGPTVSEGALCTFHFSGYLEYADEAYDSTYLRNQPYKRQLDEVIIGLKMALLSMKAGERSQFLVRPEYGYGQMGIRPRIPGNAELLMDVHLISFVPYQGVDSFFRKPYSERKNAPFSEVLQATQSLKKEATEYFSQRKYKQAEQRFQKALKVLEECTLGDEEDEREWNKLRLRLYRNLAIVYGTHLNQPKRAIHFCNEALGIDRNCAKSYYHKGKNLLKLDDFEAAHKALQKAKSLSPNDTDINAALKNWARQMEAHEKMEKVLYGKMLNVSHWKTIGESDPKCVEEKHPEKHCSEDIQQITKEQLEKFKEDPNIREMAIPVSLMTEAQAAYCEKTAQSLGFQTIVRGRNSDPVIRVIKPDSPEPDGATGD